MEDKNKTIRDEMYQHLESWKESGKTKKEYCKEQQIPEWKFFYWQKRYYEENNNQSEKGFVQVKTGNKKIIQSYPSIEIHYPNGVCLHLPAGTGVNIIRSMIGIK